MMAVVDTATKIQDKLRMEQWTAKNISEITTNDFGELDDMIDEINSEKSADEIVEILEEQLQRAPNNISALYSLSIIKLKNKSIDDSQLTDLLTLFREQKRWGLLEYLCKAFLRYGDNRHILRMLAECYSNTEERKKQVDIWEKLVAVDFAEANIVLQLAEEYMNHENTPKAIEFYKKLVLRSISNSDFNMVQAGWNALIPLIPHELTFFLQIENNVSKKFTYEQALLLLEHIYPHYKKNNDWDHAILILKRIFEYQPENAWARKELIRCYREKYSVHSNLDELLKSTNITQSWRNIHEAIGDFEKHISFDENNFVFHRTWGVGLIRKIERDKILIDFSKRKQHTMSLKMAMTALEILPKNHIWVLRSVIRHDKLKKMVKGNVSKTLKIIIRSFGNAVTMKKIRAELVPYILSETEWTSWNIKARKILKTDGIFGTIADLPSHYEIRAQRSTSVEKVYNSFNAEKDFSNRIKIVLDFLKLPNLDVTDSDLELSREIIDYFTNIATLEEQELSIKVSALLTLKLMQEHFPSLQKSDVLNTLYLRDVITDSQTVFQLYQQIENKELINYFLLAISAELREEIWIDAYLDILRQSPSKFLLDKLEQRGKIEETVDVIKKICTNYRTHQEAFIWLVSHAEHYSWVRDSLPSDEKITIAMAHLYDVNAIDISNKRHLSVNRKNQNHIHKYLYREEHLESLINNAHETAILQLIPILNELQKIEPVATITQKGIISKRFPHLESKIDQRARTRTLNARSVFFCLSRSFHTKQKELRYIHEVEVPLNSKEIQMAAEKGDLRENAEYKSAKERQEILNANAKRLDTEIRQAKMVEPDDFEGIKIGFGSEVHLHDLEHNRELSYIIFGPWESNPNKNIISYLSPLGNKLCGHKEGDELAFAIHDTNYNLKIMDVKKASPERD